MRQWAGGGTTMEEGGSPRVGLQFVASREGATICGFSSSALASLEQHLRSSHSKQAIRKRGCIYVRYEARLNYYWKCCQGAIVGPFCI